MAVTKEQRRVAFIALMLTASAGGGYVAKDELIAIGQRYCGPVPKAVLELRDIPANVAAEMGVQGLTAGSIQGGHPPQYVNAIVDATPDNIARVNAMGARGVKVKLQLNQATGLLAAWCDPDRQRLDDTVDVTLTKGAE